MPLADFAVETYARAPYGIPQSRLVNMYCEDTPQGPGSQARLPRPGLVKQYSVGTGPIRGVFWKDGVVEAARYAVSGTEVYAGQTKIGDVAAGSRAYMAGSNSQLGIVIGGNLYCWDGVTFQHVQYFFVQATATLTLTANPSAGEAVAINVQVYTFVSALTGDNQVVLGATAVASLGNLIAAINGGTGRGTVYSSNIPVNSVCTAAIGAGTTMGITSIVYGIAGTAYLLEDTLVNGTWDGETAGGVDPLPSFSGITYGAERFYLTITDSDQYDYCNLSDLTQIDPLNFATAESEPDPNRQVAEIGDEVWFFGTETVEPWYQTGNNDAPLQRSQGRRFEKGCAAQATVLTVDNALFFLGSDNIVYRSGQVPVRISTHGIESQINKCADVTTCFAFQVNYAGHTFYVLTAPGVASFAYDVAKSQWSEWQSYGRTEFIASCGQMVMAQPYLGSGVDGSIYTLSDTANTDDGQPMTLLASVYIPVKAGRAVNNSLMIQCSRGLGAAGQCPPVVSARYSDDQGRTWSPWRDRSLGVMGEYRRKAIWRNLGLMESPGRYVEFRTTDPVPVAYEYVTFNEARP